MENKSNIADTPAGKSILDQILTNHQAEEVARLDAVEIIGNLFGELNERERDILVRRFGLHGRDRETLENIGSLHKLTRERIRQIETAAVKKLRQLKNLEEHISNLKKVIIHLLEEHGGLMEREYLLDNLVNFSAGGGRAREEDVRLHKSHLDFLISKILHNHFEEVGQSKYFKSSFKLKHQDLSHLEELAEELLEKIREAKKIFTTEEMINFFNELESYRKYREKLTTPNNLDISNILGSDLYEEPVEVINANKAFYSVLQALREVEQNKFGHWGASDSREIKPKTINDKIYLVLKNNRKPMHFVEITEKIKQIIFDDKDANAATVHNELILDDKYVLVGRGIYGLAEWGYKKGTVLEVIEEILSQSDRPLSRDEIIEKVDGQRLVKKATIILTLMNKDKFEKVNGKYKLRAK